MRLFFAITLTILVAISVSQSGLGVDDPIKKKLDSAKEKFEKEMKKVRMDIKKLFDEQEEAARKAKKDNSKLLEEVNDARKALEEYGILGEKVPQALRKQAEKACND